MDEISHLELEVLGLWVQRDDSTTRVMDFLFGGAIVQVENALPQTPGWINAKESFTKCDKTRYVEDGVGCELMQLHGIDKKEPTKEFVGGERKPSVDEGKEKYQNRSSRRGMISLSGIITSTAFGSSPVFLSLVRSFFMKPALAQ
jgi:hypothetical protein